MGSTTIRRRSSGWFASANHPNHLQYAGYAGDNSPGLARAIGPPRNRDPPRRSRAGAGEGRQWCKAIVVCRVSEITSQVKSSARVMTKAHCRRPTFGALAVGSGQADAARESVVSRRSPRAERIVHRSLRLCTIDRMVQCNSPRSGDRVPFLGLSRGQRALQEPAGPVQQPALLLGRGAVAVGSMCDRRRAPALPLARPHALLPANAATRRAGRRQCTLQVRGTPSRLQPVVGGPRSPIQLARD